MNPGEALEIVELISSLVKCYLMKAEIKDAKRRKGICASIFKNAQQFMAYYYHYDESQTICYNDEDLEVKLLFSIWKFSFNVAL